MKKVSKSPIKIKAVIDYPDYVKLKGLLEEKNGSEASVLAAQDVKKSFNLGENVDDKEADPVQIVPKDEKREESELLEESREPNSPKNNLAENVPANYKSKAERLFKALGLDSYEGGLFTLDNVQYDGDFLREIIRLLYGKANRKGEVRLKGSHISFLTSLKSRRLASCVKNKKFLKLLSSEEDWWDLTGKNGEKN